MYMAGIQYVFFKRITSVTLIRIHVVAVSVRQDFDCRYSTHTCNVMWNTPYILFSVIIFFLKYLFHYACQYAYIV